MSYAWILDVKFFSSRALTSSHRIKENRLWVLAWCKLGYYDSLPVGWAHKANKAEAAKSKLFQCWRMFDCRKKDVIDLMDPETL